MLPKQEKHVKMNDSFIFIHHIHAYRKKIIHPKVHKYLDFYVTEMILTNFPQIPRFLFWEENRLLQLKIDLFLTVK